MQASATVSTRMVLPHHPEDAEKYTATYAFSGGEIGHAERSWIGRAFIHPACEGPNTRPVPLVVFLHGLNPTLVAHAWLGGATTPDLRHTWAKLIDTHRLAPCLLAGPTTNRACTVSTALWTGFDLDRFVARTIRSLSGRVSIDLSRIILVGHSGAGCNARGGLITAIRTSLPLLAVLAVDTCMSPQLARNLRSLTPKTDAVVTYQPTWKRQFDRFRRIMGATRFLSQDQSPVRVVDKLPARRPVPHEAIVSESIARWIPFWLNHNDP